MHSFTRSTIVHSFVVVSILTLAACNGGGDGGHTGGPGNITGTIDFVPAAMMIAEVEPNDSVDQPQPIGELRAGRSLGVHGSIGAGEGFDAFAFTAPERVHVEVELAFARTPEREVQVRAFDPVTMSIVAEPDARGRLHFVARGPFDVVVRAPRGSGTYDLNVHAESAATPLTRGGWSGSIAVGDTLRLAPAAAQRFEFSALEAQSLSVRVHGSATARIVDMGAEVELAQSHDGLATAEIPALAHISVQLDAMCSADVATSEPAPALVPRDTARIATESIERASWQLASDEPAYARTTLRARVGELLVKPRAGADITLDLARRSLVDRDRIDGEAHLTHIDLPASSSERERQLTTLALVRSLAASPRVEYAELNLIRTAQGVPTFTPNDPFFSIQWHYTQIHLPEAWALAGMSLPQVVVGVIDTGERAHVDLDANLLPGFDFISDPTVAGDGDGVDANPHDEGDSEGVGPSSFHGTHVAGTIAAVTNNGIGVSGIGLSTKVRHLRVLGKGGGTDFDIARAVRYAAGLTNTGGIPLIPAKVDVINMSLGSTGQSTTLRDACAAAHAAGVVIFAAAGNNNSSVPFFPASYPDVISVSAVDINSQKAPYSNFNASVDLCAPGGDTSENTNGDMYPDGVLSTLVDQSMASLPIYVFYQGTSMASPHAAGVAALMKAVNPTLTADQIESEMKASCTDLGAPGQDPIFGVGLINALVCVQLASGAAGGTPNLSVTPMALNFGTNDTQIDLALANIGAGVLHVNSAVQVVAQPWLTLTNVASSSGTINVGAVHAVVDRTGLADGDYTATIRISWNNGTTNVTTDVPVTMSVATITIPSVQLFLIAVDVSGTTPVTKAQAIVDPSVALAYALDATTTDDGQPLPVGDYLIVCGSDDDHDGFICGTGDTYCGFYPTSDEPTLVHVSGNVGSINFVVGPTTDTTASTDSTRRGYRLLRR